MLQRCSTSEGSQPFSRSLKPGISSEARSLSSPRSTQASNTGKLAQMLGPRNVSTFRICIYQPVLCTILGSDSLGGIVGLDPLPAPADPISGSIAYYD